MFDVSRYEELSRQTTPSPRPLLRHLKSCAYVGFFLSAVLQIVSNDWNLVNDPVAFLAAQFYGASLDETSIFRCRDAFRLYVCLNYVVFSLYELCAFRVVLLFCALALRLAEHTSRLPEALTLRRESTLHNIARARQLCANMNSHFAEMLAAWCLVFVMTVIAFLQICIDGFRQPSQTVMAQVLANPDKLFISVWFVVFCYVVKQPYQRAALLKITLNELNEATNTDVTEDVLYSKLLYRLCDENRLTLQLWQTIPFDDTFFSGAFQSILMFGVTLHQVTY